MMKAAGINFDELRFLPCYHTPFELLAKGGFIFSIGLVVGYVLCELL